VGCACEAFGRAQGLSLGHAHRQRKYRQCGWQSWRRPGRTMINRKGKGATMRPCPSLVTLSVSLLTLLLLSAGPAAGKTLYVKTSGNDSGSCTATAPCKTITHAV